MFRLTKRAADSFTGVAAEGTRTYSLTHLLTYLPTYLPTYLFTYLLTYLLTYLPIPTYLLT